MENEFLKHRAARILGFLVLHEDKLRDVYVDFPNQIQTYNSNGEKAEKLSCGYAEINFQFFLNDEDYKTLEDLYGRR